MLGLDTQEGFGFAYDCFYDPAVQTLLNELNECLTDCREPGFGNRAEDVSYNPQLSCRNACQMRREGLNTNACERSCDRTERDERNVEIQRALFKYVWRVNGSPAWQFVRGVLKRL